MKRWYVVQIYAGYEDAIAADMSKRIVEQGLQEYFGQVLSASAKARDMLLAAEDVKGQQLFPGYLLVEMQAIPEAIRLVETTPRVIRFLGGKQPAPLSQKEVDRIMAQISGEVALESKDSGFVVGSEIEIVEGPFAGFVGIVEEVNEENERLKIMVSIFGRMTPVELGFEQVKR
jgi:transcription termination/antitermination protein NusG